MYDRVFINYHKLLTPVRLQISLFEYGQFNNTRVKTSSLLDASIWRRGTRHKTVGG